jgi:hypothetical protein
VAQLTRPHELTAASQQPFIKILSRRQGEDGAMPRYFCGAADMKIIRRARIFNRAILIGQQIKMLTEFPAKL